MRPLSGFASRLARRIAEYETSSAATVPWADVRPFVFDTSFSTYSMPESFVWASNVLFDARPLGEHRQRLRSTRYRADRCRRRGSADIERHGEKLGDEINLFGIGEVSDTER